MVADSGASESHSRRRADNAWRHAGLAQERAAREARYAERHESLAGESGDAFHDSMAAIHRRVEARHLTTARLQETFARRLTQWLADCGTSPLFMSEVARACNTGSAALTLVGSDLTQLAVAASDRPARSAQDLEYLLGIGPARDAARDGIPVSASGGAMERRWPSYGSGLTTLGISTVFAVPLKTSSGCLGALTVFDPRHTTTDLQGFAQVAEALTDTILLAPDVDPELGAEADVRAVVHQAAGALAERGKRPVADALALIKAHAFASGEPLESVAQRIMSGTLDIS
ncbi:ANTAR domain-containing protein [Streptomyces kroppenstedtii]|uniref:ANTAR domain-containing protein n=1 Tax=Streptomyces kroppenstedtii TaxID=3051181 RepID=UPI0028D3B0AC|nr:ANTAR domain-containing protein [Streptomyces sp. DSM 40484]